MAQLSETQIINLGKHTGREIERASLEDLYLNPETQAQIHLGAVVTKDAMLNSAVEEIQKFVPEDVDDSF